MNIKAILKSGNNRIYKLLLILIAGICMLIIVWPPGRNSVQKNEDSNVADSYGTNLGGASGTQSDGDTAESGGDEAYMRETSEYTKILESRLTNVLESMGGISDVSVMITVKDNGQRIALKDRNTSQSEGSDSSQTSVTEGTVLEKTGDSNIPYVTKYVQPEVEGVVVCCNGAENAEIALKITNAVQALFDVPTHKIVILEAN